MFVFGVYASQCLNCVCDISAYKHFICNAINWHLLFIHRFLIVFNVLCWINVVKIVNQRIVFSMSLWWWDILNGHSHFFVFFFVKIDRPSGAKFRVASKVHRQQTSNLLLYTNNCYFFHKKHKFQHRNSIWWKFSFKLIEFTVRLINFCINKRNVHN